eukprot:2269040-Rhodomonas_salina.1
MGLMQDEALGGPAVEEKFELTVENIQRLQEQLQRKEEEEGREREATKRRGEKVGAQRSVREEEREEEGASEEDEEEEAEEEEEDEDEDEEESEGGGRRRRRRRRARRRLSSVAFFGEGHVIRRTASGSEGAERWYKLRSLPAKRHAGVPSRADVTDPVTYCVPDNVLGGLEVTALLAQMVGTESWCALTREKPRALGVQPGLA